MKKMLFTMAAAFMMSAAAFAQGNGGGQRPQMDREQMIKMRTDRTVEQYKLNEEQAKQLLELNTKYADTMMMGLGGRGRGQGGPRMRGQGGGFGQGGGQMPELTPEQQAQRDEMRKQREESTKAYNAELEKILTPEQYKQYQEDQQNRGRRGGGQRGGQRPPRGPRQQNQQNLQNT